MPESVRYVEDEGGHVIPTDGSERLDMTTQKNKTSYLQAVRYWRENIRPTLPENDRPALSESWGVYLDQLNRSGEITDEAYQNWQAPQEARY